jgi:putative Mn2+ efflux pump MntP
MNHLAIVAASAVVFVGCMTYIAFTLGAVVGRQRAFRDSMEQRVRDVRDGRI